MTSSKPSRPREFEEFLAQHGWLRPLARTLVASGDADDLVQDTLTQLVVSPPPDRGSPRSWLARVLRNAHRMRRRAEARRLQRERKASHGIEPTDLEAEVVRAERLRLLASLVDGLDRPLREVVVQHYFEGRSLADIARGTDTPDGTVRWRLKQALDVLRRRLDERHGGDRLQWLAAWAPWVGPSTSSAWIGPAVAGVAVVAAVSLGATAYAVATRRPEARSDPPAVAEASVARDGAPVATPEAPPLASTARPRPPSTAIAPDPDAAAPGLDLMAARLRRLERVGDQALIATASANPQLLADIEQMMLLEDASDLASACKESSPPGAGMLYVDVRVVGRREASNVVEEVRIDEERSEVGDREFRACLLTSLLSLDSPPLAPGVDRTVSLFFDTDQAEGVLAGQAED